MATYCYDRVSTNEQGASTEQQGFQLGAFCSEKGFDNPIFLSDTDTSRKTFLFKRKDGSKLKNLQKGDVVISCKHDRMFGNLRDAVCTIDDWDKAGVIIYFLNISREPINMKDINVEMMVMIMMVFSQAEVKTIGSRVKASAVHKKANKLVYAPPPYGWNNKITKNEQGKVIESIMVENEEEQIVLDLIKIYRSRNMTYKEIADQLNTDGYKAKKGGLWQFSVIKKILGNQINN